MKINKLLNREKIIVILLFIFSLFIRTYKLDQIPVGLLWDEAAIGYNAFSVLKTGKDEYGKILPIIFKSFGDYKPGFYIYTAIPPILIFGLNHFSVRFPSAFFGSLSIVFFYLLLKKSNKNNQNLFPLIGAFLLSVNPWHVNFSRGAWEINLMLFQIITALYFLISYLESEKVYKMFLSVFIFLLILLTYQAGKFLIPVLLFGFLISFYNEIKSFPKKQIFGFSLLILVGFILFLSLTFSGKNAGRLKTLSIFSYPRSEEETRDIYHQDNRSNFNFILFHEKPVFFLRSVLGRYLNHYSGKFLFFSGDWSNPRNGVVYCGVLYYPDMLFLIVGLVVVISLGKISSLDKFMFYWLVIAPIPSALSRDIISSVRSYSMVVPLVYFISIGASFFFTRFKYRIFRISIFIVYLFFIIKFFDYYFVHDKYFNSRDRLYGYKEMIEYIKPVIKSKNKVIISDFYGQPYIFYLFYTKYDPIKYQQSAKLVENPWGDVGRVEKIDNIEFKKIFFPDDRSNQNSLFVGNEFDLPVLDLINQPNVNYLKEIKNYSNQTMFRIAETK